MIIGIIILGILVTTIVVSLFINMITEDDISLMVFVISCFIGILYWIWFMI